MDLIKLGLNKVERVEMTESEVRMQAAIISGVGAAVTGFVLRLLFGAPLVPEVLADFIFAVAPISLIEFGVSLLGSFAKRLAFAGCFGLYVLALAGYADLMLRYTGLRDGKRLASLAAAGWVATLGVVMPALGAGFSGAGLRQGPIATASSLAAVHLVQAGLLILVSDLHHQGPIARSVVGKKIGGRLVSPENRFTRRRVLGWLGYAVVVVAAYDIARSLASSWWLSGSGRVKDGTDVFPNISGLALEVTPNADFYQISKNPFDPEVNAATWKLEIGGLVENPLSFTYDDIKGLTAVEQYATIECISNEVGGNLIGNALWRGVQLKDLLDKAALKPGVVDVVLHAADGYADSISLDRARQEGTILVYEMNGEPLKAAHGFPVRVIVPGIFGMKNVKWLTRIEAVDFDFKGYWQKRGWDDRAEYKTMSRIDVPENDVAGETSVAGIAFAGDRGVRKVEVSFDGGVSWEPAEIRPALSAFTWVLWHLRWSPGSLGRFELRVRATDGRGEVQTSQMAPPIPAGASGHHWKVVKVGETA